MNARSRGFTLLELMVAMVILAIIAAIGYGTVTNVTRQYHQAESSVDRLAHLQRTMMLLTQDLSQVQARPVRGEFHGDVEAAVLGGPDQRYPLELTRGGWSNPGQRRRATLQRAAWRLEDGRIERLHWQLLDRAQQQDPIVTPLVAGVERFEWRFMDRAREWHDAWPPVGAQQPPDELPRAAELTILMENGDEIRRLFALRAY